MIRRRPVRPLAGPERARRHEPPLAAGDEDAAGAGGDVHPVAGIRQSHQRHRRGRDGGQLPAASGERPWSRREATAAGTASTTRSKTPAAPRSTRPPFSPPRALTALGSKRHPLLGEGLDQPGDQSAHAAPGGQEGRAGWGTGPPQGEQEAAAPPGGGVELGRHGLRGQQSGVAGMDAAEQRVDQAHRHLAAEAAADEVGDGEVLRPVGPGAAPRPGRRAGGRSARAVRERRTGRIRPGTPSIRPSGRARSLPPTHNRARPASGATSSASMPSSPHRRRPSGTRAMKASAPSSTGKPAKGVVEMLAAQPARLEDGDLGGEGPGGQLPGRGQAGDAATDHRHVHAGGGSAWTRSTRRASTSGSVWGSTPWPRLKMWPGPGPAAARMARAWSATTGHGARHTAGSRLP